MKIFRNIEAGEVFGILIVSCHVAVDIDIHA